MNPRLTDRALYDHSDFIRGSGLPLDYFRRRDRAADYLIGGAILAVILLALLYLAACP